MSAIGAARISGQGVATTNTASARTGSPDAPGGTATTAVTGQEEGRVPVGHPHERRPLLSRLGHQPHERRICALGGGAHCTQLEGAARTGDAAAHLPAPMDGDREWFARQRRLVQDGLLALDQAVDRHHLAGADEHDVARPDRVDRHLHQIGRRGA